MAEQGANLVKRRGIIKGQLTRVYNYVTQLPVEVLDFSECQARGQKIKELWGEFDVVQSELEDLDGSEAQLQERHAFEASYYRTLAEITKRITPKSTRTMEAQLLRAEPNHARGMSSQDKVKLPTLDLSKFDGTYSQWLLFRDTFQALVDKNTVLENIQKFYYLKSCLHGNAAQILQSLEMSADNYATAWDLLKSRYENKRLLIYHHIQVLFEVNSLMKESASQLRKLIDDTQKHLRALRTLGEPTDS
ncbi:hypothetical protein X777_00247 [Ooceraea biroi]|uniref:Uncharacterized protein n=1 Tax=Ooceraea biroi TaxID=2015173 RepID=A0A026VRJ9_OOCBI|nr:hypothetical protein X777_00247 [Ooceraea biroi]